MKPEWIITDEYDGRQKLLAEAIVNSVSTKEMSNSNGTKYYLANVTVTMPHDGSTQRGTTMIYEKLQDMMEFDKGDAITLLIEIDGEYRGYSKVYLAKSAALDVSAYAEYAGVPMQAEAAAPITP